jgi:hypothetical protein
VIAYIRENAAPGRTPQSLSRLTSRYEASIKYQQTLKAHRKPVLIGKEYGGNPSPVVRQSPAPDALERGPFSGGSFTKARGDHPRRGISSSIKKFGEIVADAATAALPRDIS